MKIDESAWSLAEGVLENGNPFLLKFRDYFPSEEKQLKYCFLIEITWRYENSGGGMPDEITLDKMHDFEVLVDDGIGVEEYSLLMSSITGDNKKFWHFYTFDSDLFLDKLNEVLIGYEILPLEIEIFQDEEWNAYKELVGGVTE
jgi:hypothetical protein